MNFHELEIFGGASVPFRVSAAADFGDSRLRVRFRLAGEAAGIALPERNPIPARRDGLWERTCFEVFLKPADGAGYWEFNFSPSGDWAAYRFAGYRTGRCDETRVNRAGIRQTASRQDLREWDAEADLSGASGLGRPEDLRCGLTAVIVDVSGGKTYWALAHRGSVPDFHLARSFILVPDGPSRDFPLKRFS